MTTIPYSPEDTHSEINALVAQVATDEKLTLFDIAPRYLAELTRDVDDALDSPAPSVEKLSLPSGE